MNEKSQAEAGLFCLRLPAGDRERLFPFRSRSAALDFNLTAGAARMRCDLPTCRPADLPTCRPADLPTCRPADPPTRQPANPPT
ncbi:hypothetical protein, partial [Burkholderia arboris]|uniref:hypothetical protein n=1 Tax=Burkholderia arboris TaxID=488730 RepID=UPI003C7BFAE6